MMPISSNTSSFGWAVPWHLKKSVSRIDRAESIGAIMSGVFFVVCGAVFPSDTGTWDCIVVAGSSVSGAESGVDT